MIFEKTRQTRETNLEIKIAFKESEPQTFIQTGVGFLDHMLELFAFHSQIDLYIKAEGDTFVDDHHTTEDIGIVLGQLLLELTKSLQSFNRYGVSYLPMDETLARTVVDISGRPYLVFQAPLSKEKVGTFDTELVEEFFRALVINARLTVHMDLIRGGNTHHEIEALFKSFGRALNEALSESSAYQGVPSSKGVIE
ncbi:imidazoleglycerol-phosphate dehydratase HisB [Staphylococcus massiliensis]|uniref:Imidazoleglycerol-phosphate dehydratase n=1 Tax=Staphylococcus massiliensis S46 TaxID=1229783 RepID=K9AWP7_9STAP|nr:imidazoleglycerol-phosphate dehydratase HisB [Staphylococcus massiliensis]EKU50526.1 imidazoleglycerol-phosphate dehydratase [Staphylococcus massiliensis S46]MCG3398703.1 imidazoleglycerol-phosphate dehydratase HisB [Staphylococcus massiliensis]MCG3401264.1 imidazoleglycerol-phosphate dehydratase HisB [Staphylococcus massiliensis]POA00396.1 imidazoleglycerol-phosphate dehydratase HisB [Staphylococcus massiliensis CCUG 55927]